MPELIGLLVIVYVVWLLSVRLRAYLCGAWFADDERVGDYPPLSAIRAAHLRAKQRRPR